MGEEESMRTPKEDLLIGGLDDWADAGWVCSSASITGLSQPNALRTFSIGLIAEVLIEGLMIAGDVDESGHRPWPEPPIESIEKIVLEWLRDWPDDVPQPGAIVWLANTPSGDEFALRALRREIDVTQETSPGLRRD